MNSLAVLDMSGLNGLSVGIFGFVLSAAFCDISWSTKNRWIMAGAMGGLLLVQGFLYLRISEEVVRFLYPIITHMPLGILLGVMSKKPLWSTIVVFTAYLCCFPRRWIALLIVSVCSGGPVMQDAMELLLTFPMLFLLLKYVAPSVRLIAEQSPLTQMQFGILPILIYLFDYLTQIYTDLFSVGNPAVSEFMAFVCSAAYLVFILQISQEQTERAKLELVREHLNLQVSQSVREIENLRESQIQTKTYRHDLRHHLQYISGCIENGRLEQAQTYIKGINSEIEGNALQFFCENESANLIFSSFAGRAKKKGIPLEVRAQISKTISVSESDLCVLLSNSLENALNASEKCKEKGLVAGIEVSVYEKNGKMFLQIVNPCVEPINFENGIPVTTVPGHGMGVRSICALVEQYGGIYSFGVKADKFVLRMSL